MIRPGRIRRFPDGRNWAALVLDERTIAESRFQNQNALETGIGRDSTSPDRAAQNFPLGIANE
jgi:hypothetical protein